MAVIQDDSIYTKCLNRQIHGDKKEVSDCQGLAEGGSGEQLLLRAMRFRLS
jgi:hypothetical protein